MVSMGPQDPQNIRDCMVKLALKYRNQEKITSDITLVEAGQITAARPALCFQHISVLWLIFHNSF